MTFTEIVYELKTYNVPAGHTTSYYVLFHHNNAHWAHGRGQCEFLHVLIIGVRNRSQFLESINRKSF